MKTTSTLTIVVLLAVTAAVAVPAVHKYETQKVSATVKTTDYKALYTASSKQVKSLTNANGVLQATETQLTSQKTQLCSDLSAHKVTEALCK